jgi:hypothetical protein
MLEDLVLAALNDAVAQIDAMQRSSMGGIDLGALGGMTGLGDPAGGALGGLPGFGAVLDTSATDAPTDAVEAPSDDDRP